MKQTVLMILLAVVFLAVAYYLYNLAQGAGPKTEIPAKTNETAVMENKISGDVLEPIATPEKAESAPDISEPMKGAETNSDGTVKDPWLNGFSYRQPITISSGAALTYYQVKMTISTSGLVSGSKLQSDCDDLRFTTSDGYTQMDYWLESGCNSASTIVWVEVPSVANGSTTVYMYYGNSSASAGSNGVNAFVFFDDFDDGSLDTNKWATLTLGTCTISETSGKLKMAIGSTGMAGCGVVAKNTITATDYMIESSMMREGYYGQGEMGVAVGFTDKYSVGSYGNYGAHDGFFSLFRGVSNQFRVYHETAMASGSLTWETLAGKYVRSSTRYLHTSKTVYSSFSWGSSSQTLGPTGAGTNQLSSIYPWTHYGDYNATGRSGYTDFVAVRKYAASEPTASAGSEVQLITQAGTGAASWTWKAPAAGDYVKSGSATSWTWVAWQNDSAGLTVPYSAANSWTWYPQ